MIADYTIHITDNFITAMTFYVIGIAYGVVGMILHTEHQRRKSK